MRDDELDHYLLKMYEKAAGPLADYLTAEELVSALCRAPGFDSSPPTLLNPHQLRCAMGGVQSEPVLPMP